MNFAPLPCNPCYSYSSVYNEDASRVLEHAKRCKVGHEPHFPDGKNIKLVLTDMDHHPYRRFFRGVYWKPVPVIHSRYAGYRPYMEI
jgi:hypothetical protein